MKQKGLNGNSRKVVHRRPWADAGHPQIAHAINNGNRSIHPMGGKQFFISGLEVDSGHTHRSSQLPAIHHFTIKGVRIPQHGLCILNLCRKQGCLNTFAADRKVVIEHWLNREHFRRGVSRQLINKLDMSC